MAFDLRATVMLQLFRDGLTFKEVAGAIGITVRAIYNRMEVTAFAEAVAEAREAGRPNRERLIWYRHPFRGKRPPTGKGHGGKPRFNGKMRKMNRFRG